MTENTATPSRPGDARLAHALRCVGRLRSLPTHVREAQAQLALIDDVKHDEPVDDATLSQLKNWQFGYATTALRQAVRECENSLRSLRAAHASVFGLFKGQLKDESEEMLARTIKMIEHRLAQLRQTEEGFSPSKIPHEIRRTALSAMIIKFEEAEDEIKALIDGCPDVSEDFMEDLRWSQTQLGKLRKSMGVLRDRCTQKIGMLLEQSVRTMDAITLCMFNVELASAQRSGMVRWYPDLR